MDDAYQMKVHCKKEHVSVFEKLEFRVSQACATGLIEMVDENAAHAHDGEMPEDIPYLGRHSSGRDYGSRVFACDGKKLAFVRTNNDSPVVRVTPEGHPMEADVAGFLEYEACRKAAWKALGLTGCRAKRRTAGCR